MDNITEMKMNRKQEAFVSSLLNDGPVTILNFEDDRIILEVMSNVDSHSSTTLQAGSMKRIFNYLQQEPATAFELEAAISAIEDELMPIIALLPSLRCLVTSEPSVHDIAKIAGLNVEEDVRLEITAVERLFNCLADVAYGTPAKLLDIPENREFAATVLFLRELMHHADFSFVLNLQSL